MDVALKQLSDWTAQERSDLRTLNEAVYPPAQVKAWPGNQLKWSKAKWGVQVLDDADELASYVGVHVRRATHNQQQVTVGGLGGIKTHPQSRGRGYAGLGIRCAVNWFRERSVDFALLVCDQSLLAYYAGLDWQPFAGTLLTAQQEGTVEFTFNAPMVLDVCAPAPSSGVIDLLGPPW